MKRDIALERDLVWLSCNYGNMSDAEQILSNVVEKQSQYLQLILEINEKQQEAIETLKKELYEIKSQVSINTCNLRS